jgi:hypothetical protein
MWKTRSKGETAQGRITKAKHQRKVPIGEMKSPQTAE